jgi:hypothetical protein
VSTGVEVLASLVKPHNNVTLFATFAFVMLNVRFPGAVSAAWAVVSYAMAASSGTATSNVIRKAI